MLVTINSSALKSAQLREYLARFAVGGAITAIAGLLAKRFGPSFGGLFLAFPAILGVSATLVEKHERQRKEKLGMHGIYRGRQAAGADAAGAAMGSFGLFTFAALVWKLLPRYGLAVALPLATAGWALVAGLVWWAWKRKPRKFRQALRK